MESSPTEVRLLEVGRNLIRSAREAGDMSEGNRECAKAPVCRACNGGGVIVLNGGPLYRRCRGLEREVECQELFVWDLNEIGRDIPWWRFKERREFKRVFNRAWDRFCELVDAWAPEVE